MKEVKNYARGRINGIKDTLGILKFNADLYENITVEQVIKIIEKFLEEEEKC